VLAAAHDGHHQSVATVVGQRAVGGGYVEKHHIGRSGPLEPAADRRQLGFEPLARQGVGGGVEPAVRRRDQRGAGAGGQAMAGDEHDGFEPHVRVGTQYGACRAQKAQHGRAFTCLARGRCGKRGEHHHRLAGPGRGFASVRKRRGRAARGRLCRRIGNDRAGHLAQLIDGDCLGSDTAPGQRCGSCAAGLLSIYGEGCANCRSFSKSGSHGEAG